jgi:hypothetical protein
VITAIPTPRDMMSPIDEANMRRMLLAFFVWTALAGCQSTQHSQAELAQICANPANRAPTPGNLYFDECQALYPSSTKQLQKYYRQNAPAGVQY